MSEVASQKGKWDAAHFLLFIARTYIEKARWNRAWYHSQAKDNNIKMGQKMYGVTYKLVTQNNIRCVMLPGRDHSFAAYFLLVVQWDDCLAVKGAVVHSLAVSHGMGWDEPIQHNSITHPLAHRIRCCLESKCANPLTFYLLWSKIRLSGSKKCSNTYILPNISWTMLKCDNILCQKAWLTLYWSWNEIWWTAL